MPRQKLPDSQRREYNFPLRLSEDAMKILTKEAEKRGVTITQFIRNCIISEIKKGTIGKLPRNFPDVI